MSVNRQKLFEEAVINNTHGPFEVKGLIKTLATRHVSSPRKGEGAPLHDIRADGEIYAWHIDNGEWINLTAEEAEQRLDTMSSAKQLPNGKWEFDLLDALLKD